MLSKTSKKYISMCIVFSVLTLLFTLLYFLNIITSLDLFLTVTYVCYFAGIALLYNGGYTREQNRLNASMSNVCLGFIFLGCSIALLLYGIFSGNIVLF